MNKLSILLFTILFSAFAFGQKIEGDIAKDNRKLLTEHSSTIKGNINAVYTIAFSVNALGEVTSVREVGVKTEKASTPARMQALNHVKKFKFEPGTWFPKHHQGLVEIRMVKE